jgi:hypothetical protein
MKGDRPGPMEDFRTYRVIVRGRIEAADIGTGSPVPATVERIKAEQTWMQVRTDQSGLIGLLRHLHARGIALIAVCDLAPPEKHRSTLPRRTPGEGDRGG